jgi:uncharacterized protein
MKIKLYAPWVHSLKEKRMIVKSIIGKVRTRFNVSVIESDGQDIHKTILLGIVFAAQDNSLADSTAEKILSFIEGSSEAQITEIHKETC